MLEDDLSVAGYRDAVLWLGAVARLSVKDVMSICAAMPKSRSSGPWLLIGLGIFVLEGRRGALLAVPRERKCLDMIVEALRNAGLGNVARKVRKSARRRP